MQKIQNILLISIFIIFSFLFLYSLESVRLPDYISYSYIFQFSNFYTFESYPFASFMRLFDSYDFFRLVSLITGLGLFFFKLISERHNTSVLIVLLILCIVFIFEFYMIRLRAGWSIILVALGFFLFRKSYILSIPFFLISALFHLETALCLGFFLFTPFLIKDRPFLIAFLISTAFLLGIVFAVPQRGLWVYSELNFARVFMHLSIITFYLVNTYKRPYKNSFLDRMIFLNITFSTLICIFYFLGSFDISGEAIVRVSTLNVAVFLIYFLGKSDLNP